jgi:hypothetical protein
MRRARKIKNDGSLAASSTGFNCWGSPAQSVVANKIPNSKVDAFIICAAGLLPDVGRSWKMFQRYWSEIDKWHGR